MFEKRSHLRKFLAVVDAGKIQTAAEKLNTTQPALSRIIAQLENQFEGKLFERIPSGVRLTSLGTTVAEQARHILREIELAEDEISSAASGRSGHLRISAGPMWIQAVMPQVISKFHQTYPGIELRLRTATYREGVQLLTNGDTDLHCGGFDSDEPLPQFLRREHILDIALGVVAHRDHPIFNLPKVTPHDLVTYPWLGYDTRTHQFSEDDWPTLDKVLNELHTRTGKRVETILQCDSVGLFFLGTGPYLAYLALNFAEGLAELPLKRVPVDLANRSFNSGIIARRSIEGTTAFKHITEIIREEVLKFADVS